MLGAADCVPVDCRAVVDVRLMVALSCVAVLVPSEAPALLFSIARILRKQHLDLVPIARRVIATDPDQLSHRTAALRASQMQHQIDCVGDLIPDGLVRQLDGALHDARRESSQRLDRRIRVDRRERPGVARC